MAPFLLGPRAPLFHTEDGGLRRVTVHGMRRSIDCGGLGLRRLDLPRSHSKPLAEDSCGIGITFLCYYPTRFGSCARYGGHGTAHTNFCGHRCVYVQCMDD